MSKNTFLKKVSVGIASLALVCPLALGAVQSVSANAKRAPRTQLIAKRHAHKINKHAKRSGRKARNKRAKKLIKRNRKGRKNRKHAKRAKKSINPKLTKREKADNAKINKALKKHRRDEIILNSSTARYYANVKKNIKNDRKILNSKSARYYAKVNKDSKRQIKIIYNTPNYETLDANGIRLYKQEVHDFYAKLPATVNRYAGKNRNKIYRFGIRQALTNKFDKKLAHNKEYRAGNIWGRFELNKPVYKTHRQAYYHAKYSYKSAVKDGMGTGTVAQQIFNNIYQAEFQNALK